MGVVADYEAIENAVHGWVCSASGLPGSKVVWESQGGPRPQRPFVTLRLDSVQAMGAPEQRTRDAEDPAPGADLVIEEAAQNECTVTVQAFTEETTGNASALRLVSRCRNALETETTVDALDAVGLAIVERGTIQNLTGLLETHMEGRAALDVRLRFVDGAEVLTTWIETAEVRSTFRKE